MMSDNAEIHRVIADRADTIRRKDASAAVDYYSDDVVNFDLAPPLAYRGQEATKPDEIQGWFDTWTGPIGIAFDKLVISSTNDLGFAHGLLHLTGRRDDGSETDVWARMTLCLERRAGDWKIVHEHQSFPTKMDGSGLSASDLKP